MNPLPFVKMEGLGNDYVYVFSPSGEVKEPERLARTLSDRRTGIGADGLVVISLSEVADGAMRIFNSDGSEAEMCGNAIRCVARYLHDRGLAPAGSITVETTAGLLGTQLALQDGEVAIVTADLGEPRLDAEAIGLGEAGDNVLDSLIHVDGEDVRVSCLSMGNPHAVLFVPQITDSLVHRLGPRLEKHPAFSRGTNVEFAEVVGQSHLRMRVWERGSGETSACGTGAAAVVVAAALTGRTSREATVTLPGGDLLHDWRDDGHVYQTGPAHLVFEGAIDLTSHDLPADAVPDAQLPALVQVRKAPD
jgi:diaminopimelate epimerase